MVLGLRYTLDTPYFTPPHGIGGIKWKVRKPDFLWDVLSKKWRILGVFEGCTFSYKGVKNDPFLTLFGGYFGPYNQVHKMTQYSTIVSYLVD